MHDKLADFIAHGSGGLASSICIWLLSHRQVHRTTQNPHRARSWSAKVWDLTVGQVIKYLDGHESGVHSVSFSPGTTWLSLGQRIVLQKSGTAVELQLTAWAANV